MLNIEELLCYNFELVIAFRVDHAMFHQENNQTYFHVCQGEIFAEELLEELPDVIDQTGEHE